MKLFIYKNGTGELHETIPDVLRFTQNDKCIDIYTKPVAEDEAPNRIIYSKPEFYVRTLM